MTLLEILLIIYLAIYAIEQRTTIMGCEARGDKDSPYLTRYTLIKLFGFQICLHIFHRSDADELHDHPWPFITLLLWRGYIEETLSIKKRYYPGMVLKRKAAHLHRVELVDGKKAITLVLMGRYERHWGFKTAFGWVYWKEYFKEKGC